MPLNLWKSIKEIFGWIEPERSQNDEKEKEKNQIPKPRSTNEAIEAAVKAKLEDYVRRKIPEHQKIARHQVFELHRIEIRSASNPEAVQRFLDEFDQESRYNWVNELIAQTIGPSRMLKLDRFSGIYGEAELSGEADPHSRYLNEGNRSDYQVDLIGAWAKDLALAPPLPPEQKPPFQPAPSPGLKVKLTISDAQGRRLEIHEQYPFRLGKAKGVSVQGKYVSGDHCVFHSDGRSLWLEDISTNGTWVDGQRALKGQRLELERVCQLKLGQEHGSLANAPEIRLEIINTPIAIETPATPIDTGGFTPIVRDVDEALLAVLDVQDATGKFSLDVMRLPYSLGLGEGRDYKVPSAHQGVSGLHLVIESLEDAGAWAFNPAHAKNGTALDGKPQPERFLWPFGAEVALACQWRQGPPPRIVLKRPD